MLLSRGHCVTEERTVCYCGEDIVLCGGDIVLLRRGQCVAVFRTVYY